MQWLSKKCSGFWLRKVSVSVYLRWNKNELTWNFVLYRLSWGTFRLFRTINTLTAQAIQTLATIPTINTNQCRILRDTYFSLSFTICHNQTDICHYCYHIDIGKILRISTTYILWYWTLCWEMVICSFSLHYFSTGNRDLFELFWGFAMCNMRIWQ